MKTLFSKRLIYRLTSIRIFAIAFLLGVTGFWIWHWQNQIQPIPKVFLVQLPPNLSDQKIITQNNSLEMIIQNRNLDEYDRISISNCAYESDDEYRKCEKLLEKGRKFILDHWRKKKRVYIIYDWSGVDAGVQKHIFIEPDAKGNWHLSSRWEGSYSTSFFENVPKVYSNDTVLIKSKKIKKDSYPFRAGKFYLIFFDENGKEIGTL